jgi:ATP-binding cassette subfamily B protein
MSGTATATAEHATLTSDGKKRRTRLRRALKFAFPYKRAVVGIFFITLLVAAANAIEPIILKYLFDNLASDGRSAKELSRYVLWLVGLGLFRELANGVSNWITWHTRLGIHYALLDTTVERLHRLPLGFHRNEGVGAIMTKLDRGIQGFISAVTQILFNIFPAVLYLGLSVFVMVKLDWRLAVIVLCFVPLPAVIAAFAGPEQTRRERTLLDRWAKIYSRFNEVLSGIVTVRSFSMEDVEKKRFLSEVKSANDIVVRGVGIDAGLGVATNLVITAARLTAIAVGGLFILRGQITLGTLIAFLGYVGGLFGPVQGLTGVYQTIQRAYVSLEVQETIGDDPRAIEVTHVRGDVTFENVKFTYERRDLPVLNGIDLHVNPGQTTAIVGPSGSGKTTLMALLMRFYDPNEGRILLDGVELKMLKQTSLRRNIGVVLQDPLLFNDTVRNNIAYGKPNATRTEIEAAAKAANAHAFISALPNGYDTMTGERGRSLSVGERQRVTIARALIKDPPILILDEATASLDAESEALVQEALDKLMKGRTTFVIAHRLATVVHAERIIVLRNGKVAESGTHDELMRSRGYYTSLVERQTRGLLRNDGE